VSTDLYSTVTYSLAGLIENIDSGEIGLPELQRPFVWNSAKVRDLFDSMYRGFPVGYFLLWGNDSQPGAKKIGTGPKQQPVPRLMIVDGQQRLTSLYAVLKGKSVVDDDYKETRIRIAFRPRDRRFAVTDAAIARDPEYIPDISDVWNGGGSLHKFSKEFLVRLGESRTLSESQEDDLTEAIHLLHGLSGYQFTAVELAPKIDPEQVAEVFVRINSKGVNLNQADFILTLMSVWWEEGRNDLEAFCRSSRVPSTAGPSPYNHFIETDPDQLLRVAVGLAFRRARLSAVYSVLQGRDPETGQMSIERREEQFDVLRDAQAYVLDLTNWHEFIKVLVRAGFRSSKMISSQNALIYCYLFYLVGKRDFGVEASALRDVIARWFFMVALTGRYTGSYESQVEADLARLRGLDTADAFVSQLNRVIDDVFTEDYWEITLPNEFESSAGFSPTLFGYYASLNLLDARILFSSMRVNQLMDPALNANKAPVERHHLFPRAYLKSMGVTEVRDINQIANMALVEWPDNVQISDRPPSEYFPPLAEVMDQPTRDQMYFWHALPVGWATMEYRQFLDARRELLAQVVRRGFERLSVPEESASEVAGQLADLVEEGESDGLEFKAAARVNLHTTERDDAIEAAVTKTVAAFANSQGGTLIVGITDDGEPVGLERDYATLKKQNADGFELWLVDHLSHRIGQNAVARLKIDFPVLHAVQVCRVQVPPAPEPVFVNPPSGEKVSHFFIRIGNSTRALPIDEALQYKAERWD
jgi:hypothetical protein